MENITINNPPIISVIVLTYKRQEELLRTLGGILAQKSWQVEIIVVNNYTDDTGEILAREFPKVRHVSTGGNIGCEARNIGVAAAAADIVVTIDNDVNMVGDDFPEKVLAFFQRNKKAGCVNFKVLMPDGALSLRDWCHPRDFRDWSDEGFQTDHISEGACAFRKEAFASTGGYYAPFFIGHEGPDLCMRLMKTGYEVWYSPDIEVVHHAAVSARPGWRAYYYNTRNNIWLAYRHFPGIYAVRYALFYTGMALFYALKNRNLAPFFRGVCHGVTQAAGQVRVPLDKVQFETLREINSYRPSFFSKVRKHLVSRQEYR